MNVFQIHQRVSPRKMELRFSTTNEKTANEAKEYYLSNPHSENIPNDVEITVLVVHEDESFSDYLNRLKAEESRQAEERRQELLRSLSPFDRKILNLPDPEPLTPETPPAEPQIVPEPISNPPEGQSPPPTPEMAPEPSDDDMPF